MAAPTVMAALRAFLPGYLKTKPVLSAAQHRALWAIEACRTPALGGHVYACAACSQQRFAFHSCNHKACPQCGREATRKWVAREQAKLIGAPYFMVTFTLPHQLRELFCGSQAKEAFDLFFAAAASALSTKLAAAKWLGAVRHGFTMVLHTWNQQMQFHPHLHVIVPGGGLDANGAYRQVKSAQFLLPVTVLGRTFRHHFKRQMQQRGWQTDPTVWHKTDWGLHVQPFGNGQNALKYLGAYVARSVIADSRIQQVTDTQVTFSYKDRAAGGITRTLKLEGMEFARRYLRHVLPRGLRSIRYYGFCHPAAKKIRLKVSALSGKPIDLGATRPSESAPRQQVVACPCCQKPMILHGKITPLWALPRAIVPRAPPAQSAAS